MRVAAAIACLFLAAAIGRAQSILDVGADRPTRAIVTLDERPPEVDPKSAALDSEMTRRLKGILADLQGKPLVEFRTCVPPHPFLGDTNGAERVCVIHLSAGAKSKRLDIVQAPGGAYIAIDMDAPKGAPVRAELRTDKFGQFIATWPPYRGTWDAAAVRQPRGDVFTLPKPYTPGRFTMDDKMVGERFLNGGTSNIPGTDRVLDNETLLARLPRDYDPRHPAGLIVWIDPGNKGQPPEPYWTVADELNLILIGAADSGNNRLVSNREQLALDAVATASRRYHVDPSRVYVTGLSGGGRVATMMAVCFPDVFTGCLPLSGLACYENVPNGLGQWFPGAFVKPRTDLFRLFKSHRIAPITGRADHLQLEIEQASQIFLRDGSRLKLFDYKDQGHSLPTPDRLAEALKWIDEPAQEQHAAEAAEAKKAWDAYVGRFGEKAPPDEAARRMLIKVTEAGPWTDEAWKAAGLLGLP